MSLTNTIDTACMPDTRRKREEKGPVIGPRIQSGMRCPHQLGLVLSVPPFELHSLVVRISSGVSASTMQFVTPSIFGYILICGATQDPRSLLAPLPHLPIPSIAGPIPTPKVSIGSVIDSTVAPTGRWSRDALGISVNGPDDLGGRISVGVSAYPSSR